MAWVNRGALTSVGWQVTLCDPIWLVTLCSSVMDLSIKSYIVYVPLPFFNVRTFESRLDKVWSNQPVRFCYEEELRL